MRSLLLCALDAPGSSAFSFVFALPLPDVGFRLPRNVGLL